jgi:His/Glu/Gln/Arg/opine family amino acid ABC transporter permease subunit
MTTSSSPPPKAAVYYDEPAVRPPPLLTVGALAWLRQNLFKSTFDTLLTLIAGGVSLALIVGLLSWSVGSANWLVVTQNIEQIMTGTFPRDSMWRVNVAALLCAFVTGFTIYAYTRPRFGALVLVAASVLIVVALPPLVYAFAPPVPTYLAAGSVEIAAGTQTEMPQEHLGFVGRAGEVVTVEIATWNALPPPEDARAVIEPPTDAQIVALAGFADRATGAVVNAASARLTTLSTIADLDARLSGDLLTANQRAALTEQRAALDAPEDEVSAVYAVNRASVQVDILDGATLTPLTSVTLTSPGEMLTFTLPADGWYVLRKAVEGESVALLRTTDIYPLLERNLTRTENGATARVVQYARITDRFETEALRPRLDGGSVPILVITDSQYRGVRPLGDYLRLAVAPFLGVFQRAYLPLLALALLGFAAGVGAVRLGIGAGAAARRTGSVLSDRRAPAQEFVPWLWILYLLALALLVYGASGLDAFDLALLVGRFIWVGWMYYAGMAASRAEGRLRTGILGGVMALGLVQHVLAERFTFGDPFAFKVFGVIIWMLIGYLAAQRGASDNRKFTEAAARRGLVAAGIVWLAAIIVVGLALPPLMLAAGGVTASDLLPITETRRWGGFLLTMLLTIVAIVASFPLGVLLALGRRSSLPVIRLVSIAIIELVRGVPLITVLFMAQLLVPLVNPSLAEVDNVFRAMVGLTIFSAAYLAENVRGGLQSVSGGQEEAARALGLTGWQITLFITLPQALRAVIPALVGQCIALFKDTSLVALVGLLDLTGISRGIIAQPEFVGLQSEIFFFTSVIYFIFSYVMAYVSRRIEFSGSGASRRTL